PATGEFFASANGSAENPASVDGALFVSRKKQLRIAKETAEIHAPIARRLGLNNIKIEMEGLCFKFIHPYRHRVLTRQIDKRYGNLKEVIEQIQQSIKQRLGQEGLGKTQISGRKKATYSIYKKMKTKHLKFAEVLDKYAFRVIVDDVSECYLALGIIHNLYKPLPGKFKDYIALPKVNGYQSLHTILFGPNKVFIEVQLRSKEMHFVSEYGIAAHWHYKNKSGNSKDLANNWLGSLLDIQENSGTSIEFLEETKIDLFPSTVFVFTPNGEIVQLPHRATVLDFAYAIHTKVGNHTLKAKVDKVNASLDKRLKNGQTIEIITDKNAKPQPDWLKMTVTAKAKTSIKSKLKKSSTEELIQLGEYLLNNALRYQGDGKPISEKRWQNCITELKCDSMSDLHIKIAISEILISFVLSKLQIKSTTANAGSISIKGTKGTKGNPVSFARCCYPIIGDKIFGIITNSKGMVLHRANCGNLQHAKQKGEQWLKVDLQAADDDEFEVEVYVEIENRRGILASIANAIAKININIENIQVEEQNNTMRGIYLVIIVPNIAKLDEVMYAIKNTEFVHSVKRNSASRKSF
ncbi:MAG: bifunctional (p)ppGpp synthetase/guanosine-3',5'-bis(diphosphate) 3'-pyrophosphohydrolase, partial [Candidatus Thioglobus sp.]